MLSFKVMVITDWGVGHDRVIQVVTQLAQSGRPIALQHRHVGASTAELFREARALRDAIAGRVPLFVNGRLDVAIALGAHLHLGTNAMTARDARAQMPGGRLLSVAVHRAEELQPDADLALVSPVFAPLSKPDDIRPPLGADGFRVLARQCPCPAFALGGMTPETAAHIAPFTEGVATLSSVWTAARPVEWIDELLLSLRARATDGRKLPAQPE